MSKKRISKTGNKRAFLLVLLIFSTIALITSILIAVENTNHSEALNQVCTATGSDCGAVQNSSYGKILGIKMVWWGIGAFTILSLLIIFQFIENKKNTEWLIFSAGLIAGIAGIYLISLQAFVINSYCIYCLIIDASSIIIMILVFFYKFSR
ncbi:MAG: vitamin K epoxide reductase family protein [Candidatus Nanoarchaeia archaeon]